MGVSNVFTSILLMLLNVLGGSDAAQDGAAVLTISKDGGNASSPLLYGLMFEDINNSGDGGLHGQLLKNNGFQGDSPDISVYAGVGGTDVSMDSNTPLSNAITKSLKVNVPEDASGSVGFTNAGYNGVPVNQDTYFSAFWMKGDYNGDVTISLVGSDGTVFGSSQINVNSVYENFTYFQTSFMSVQDNATDNKWQLTFDGGKVSNGSLWFDLVQLFPSTYHNRANGLRADVAGFLEDMKPSFLRFPGGNNLEGVGDPSNRWIWSNTVGPLENRPGRQGTWTYPNTDALGLLEYMYWCQDMNLAPVLAVWAGHTLPPAGQAAGESVTGDALEPYINEVMDELEFLMGDTSTKNGALRAQYGQQDPFSIPLVEIGNEDNLSGGCATYPERFTAYYNAIHAKYPDITIIASTSDASCLPSELPEGVWTDIHWYLGPDDFVSKFNEFDNAPRNQGSGIFVGEYACTMTNDGQTTFWGVVQGSIAEAVYMIGMERNSDLVKMASYAPLLEHYDLAEWSPDLVGFDARPGSLTGSVSYYIQKLFSTHRGARILEVQTDSDFNPLFWVASVTDDASPTYYIKLANYDGNDHAVTVKIPDISASTPAGLEIVSGNPTDTNHPFQIEVLPNEMTVPGSAEDGYTFTVPGWGAAVLSVSTA